jgi:hypothetical protein
VAIQETKVLLQHFLSVNPIFVVISGPKQPLQNCLSKASFMLFMFFKSTKWKHAYLLFFFSRWKPEQFSRMLSQFSHLLRLRALKPMSRSRIPGSIATAKYFTELCIVNMSSCVSQCLAVHPGIELFESAIRLKTWNHANTTLVKVCENE